MNIIISAVVVIIVSIIIYKLRNRIKRTYYETGELKSETPYVRGELIGTSNYNRNGKLIIKK